jgi:hypothetical protein
MAGHGRGCAHTRTTGGPGGAGPLGSNSRSYDPLGGFLPPVATKLMQSRFVWAGLVVVA